MCLKAKKYLRMNMKDKIKVQFLWAGESQQMVYKIYLEMPRGLLKAKNKMKKKLSLIRIRKLKIKSRNSTVKTGHLFLKVIKQTGPIKRISNKRRTIREQAMNLCEVKI